MPIFLILSLWTTLIVGWFMNIVQIVNADFSTITGLLVVKLVGIFIAPLGAILGFIG